MRNKSFIFGCMGILFVSRIIPGAGQDSNPAVMDQALDVVTIPLPGLPVNVRPLEMILVRPGSFIMGSDKKVLGSHGHPWPRHEVTITRPFYIGKFEITQAQYEWVRGEKWNHSKHKGADLPVEKLSWYDTQLFLRKLNRMGLGQFRLPTEAEWEYAGRLSDTLGIQGMKNGLCEWCEDIWQKPFDRGPRTDPRNRGGLHNLIWPMTNRVIKGEPQVADSDDASAFRTFEQSLDYHYVIGFRIVREVEK